MFEGCDDLDMQVSLDVGWGTMRCHVLKFSLLSVPDVCLRMRCTQDSGDDFYRDSNRVLVTIDICEANTNH